MDRIKYRQRGIGFWCNRYDINPIMWQISGPIWSILMILLILILKIIGWYWYRFRGFKLWFKHYLLNNILESKGALSNPLGGCTNHIHFTVCFPYHITSISNSDALYPNKCIPIHLGSWTFEVYKYQEFDHDSTHQSFETKTGGRNGGQGFYSYHC